MPRRCVPTSGETAPTGPGSAGRAHRRSRSGRARGGEFDSVAVARRAGGSGCDRGNDGAGTGVRDGWATAALASVAASGARGGRPARTGRDDGRRGGGVGAPGVDDRGGVCAHAGPAGASGSAGHHQLHRPSATLGRPRPGHLPVAGERSERRPAHLSPRHRFRRRRRPRDRSVSIDRHGARAVRHAGDTIRDARGQRWQLRRRRGHRLVAGRRRAARAVRHHAATRPRDAPRVPPGVRGRSGTLGAGAGGRRRRRAARAARRAVRVGARLRRGRRRRVDRRPRHRHRRSGQGARSGGRTAHPRARLAAVLGPDGVRHGRPGSAGIDRPARRRDPARDGPRAGSRRQLGAERLRRRPAHRSQLHRSRRCGGPPGAGWRAQRAARERGRAGHRRGSLARGGVRRRADDRLPRSGGRRR